MHSQSYIQGLAPHLLREVLVHRLQHLLDDVFGGVIAAVEVGCGEKIPLQRRGRPQPPQEIEVKVASHGRLQEVLSRDHALRVQGVGNLVQSPALDHGDEQRRDDADRKSVV